MKYLIVILGLMGLVACGTSGTEGVAELSSEQTARDASPVGEVCIHGEIEEVFQPSNRGRGNNKGTYVTVDNRTYEPAFLRGDVDYDGVAGTRADAMLGTKNIYVKQIEKELCPAVADIGIFPQGSGSDSFFTAEDIYQWNQVKKTGDFLLAGELVCLSDCIIQNHMKPGNK